MMFGSPLYWRETHKQPRFLIFDGRLVILILLVLMHIRLWTVLIVACAMMALFFFERRGISADSILRFIRSIIVGRRRTARGYGVERRSIDYGFETKELVSVEARAVERHQESRRKILEKKKSLQLQRKQTGGRHAS